jgi:hypothetical protein
MPGPKKPSTKHASTEISDLMRRVSNDPDTIPSMLATLNEKGTARLKAARDLQLISRANPSVLYPYFHVFVDLLDSSSSILLWNAIIILSHLVEVDTERRFDPVFDRYFAHLWDG